MRKESSTGSFLRLRSTRGQARAKGEAILRERSASSLNVRGASGSQKYTSLPRRTSTTFSDSQNSVQHYTVHEKPAEAETPDWKRRLVNGDDITSDGFDLFSPSKLEGIFKQPTPSQLHSDKDNDLPNDADSYSRRPFTLPASNPFSDPYSSYRAAKSRLNLDVLEEINEEEETDRRSISLVSSELERSGSVRGLVRRRVESLERSEDMRSDQLSAGEWSHRQNAQGHNVNDPRWRTISGQEELKNEFISPVTMSQQNSIRATALQNSLEVDIPTLQSKLRSAGVGEMERPTSSSSDRDISYASKKGLRAYDKDEPLPDLTSQSLPDDLSMGTQDFISHGGFINSRRGGRSNEASFLRKSLSLTQDSQIESARSGGLQFHSSPPLRTRDLEDSIEQSKLSASAPTTPQESSVVHHTSADLRPTQAGSPLKLFGNRDTYTNNKLMRILSQFEEPDSSRKVDYVDRLTERPGTTFRMSQFGQGELDGFGFAQHVPRPSPVELVRVDAEDRIFKPVTTNPTQDEVADEMDSNMIPDNAPNDPEQSKPSLADNDRTSKRRKTLLRDQINIEVQDVEVVINHLEEAGTLAGKKRKDARPGDDGTLAEPEVLASRNLLQPKSARRSSTAHVPSGATSDADVAEDILADDSEDDLAKALASELASLAEEAAQINDDSRKPSLATKDYMEEANKVMQFIRSRGKPKPALPDINEPGNVSELNPDAILDLELDGDSTKDDFSRPPSRDRPVRPAEDRRHARHDSRTASYLRKYQDDEELGASVFGTLPATTNLMMAAMPDEDLQESSPPNIRIRDQTDTMRKRKHSASTVDGQHEIYQDRELNTHQSSSHNSTQNTFPTRSSTSGQKGVIASGTVSIPDNVGAMTFDHEKKIWVRKMYAKEDKRQLEGRPRQIATEDDPFESIPDLSIDEQREPECKKRPVQNQANQEEEGQNSVNHESKGRPIVKDLDLNVVKDRDHRLLGAELATEDFDQSSLRSKASEHEAKLHDGVPSKPPAQLKEDRKQARVVTIAFSSPVVSAVNYAKLSEDDFDDLPREEDLPLDDSEIDLNEAGVAVELGPNPVEKVKASIRTMSQDSAVQAAKAVTFQPRTISPIEEHDEDQYDADRSLVHVRHANALTPAPPRTIAKLQKAGNKASSILCLTPLSDFSVHQVDVSKNPDQSYVEERKHPNALRQAHGSLALAVDELIKAITDAVPDELYWEQLRRMTFAAGSVSSTHDLKHYCPVLEELNLPDNKVAQLRGLPTSLRFLDIHNNMLNDLTSWGHLQNLQYVDVSGNQLESLEGFASLVHLRSLKANNNQISRIDGILDLNGLLELELLDNDLTHVDFEGSELTRLKSLNLSHNQLEVVRNIDCLPQLEELNLEHNVLSSFSTDDSERDLSIRTLRLSHNRLESIGLKHMPEIRHLELDNNRIRDIHGLSAAYNLEFLSLREQKESSDLIDLILSTPNECRRIRLSANPVTNGTLKLPAMPQNNLRELEIAACGLSELPEGFGTCFPNCRHLNANFNGIKDVATLRKMVHLKTVLLARNRIKKLRRTCLVLSRLGSLETVDLRDNPLTVGFYSPISAQKSLPEARYHLPEGSQIEDATWMKVLDEVTGLRRRTIELLLAEHCKKLIQLDGLSLCQARLNEKDELWHKLTEQGVLQKPTTSTEVLESELPHGEAEDVLDAQIS